DRAGSIAGEPFAATATIEEGLSTLPLPWLAAYSQGLTELNDHDRLTVAQRFQHYAAPTTPAADHHHTHPSCSARQPDFRACCIAISVPFADRGPIASARAGNRRAATKACPASGTGRQRLPFGRRTCARCFPGVRGAIQGPGQLAAGP